MLPSAYATHRLTAGLGKNECTQIRESLTDELVCNAFALGRPCRDAGDHQPGSAGATYGHYADIDFDEQWSQEAFQRYLDILDGQRSYLLNRDIEPYRHLEDDMADALFDGDLDDAFALYNRLSERHTNRLEWLLAELDDGLSLEFDSNERLEVNREDAPWASRESELDELWRKRLKNDALTLALTDQDAEQIEDNLRQRYEGHLRHHRPAYRLPLSSPRRIF